MKICKIAKDLLSLIKIKIINMCKNFAGRMLVGVKVLLLSTRIFLVDVLYFNIDVKK